MLAFSTAAAQLDSPLGRLRARALGQPATTRTGPLVESTDDIHWLEWSLAEDGDPDDTAAVEACNPAGYLTIPDLQRQRRAVTDTAFRQFHCASLVTTASKPHGVGHGSKSGFLPTSEVVPLAESTSVASPNLVHLVKGGPKCGFFAVSSFSSALQFWG